MLILFCITPAESSITVITLGGLSLLAPSLDISPNLSPRCLRPLYLTHEGGISSYDFHREKLGLGCVQVIDLEWHTRTGVLHGSFCAYDV